MNVNVTYNEDCLEGLRKLPSESVHCCVTSPPYWALRDYSHPNQIGMEETPELFTKKMMQVFAEVFRVLRDDGTLWLNLGDTYWGGKGTNGASIAWDGAEKRLNKKALIATYPSKKRPQDGKHPVLKAKQLVGAPWRVALALQGFAVVPFLSFTSWAEDLKEARVNQDWDAVEAVEFKMRCMDLLMEFKTQGWILRQDIIWAKTTPMPESVQDRCTKAHEYIFLFTKQKKYYYDALAIATDYADKTLSTYSSERKGSGDGSKKIKSENMAANMAVRKPKEWKTPDGWDTSKGSGGHGKFHKNGREKGIKGYEHRSLTADKNIIGHSGNYDKNGKLIGTGKANKRSVWIVSSEPMKEAHFATFPQKLIIDCIKAGCPENGIVLDPFMGAGTTALVARKLNRNYIGFEINNEYRLIDEKRKFKELGLFQ